MRRMEETDGTFPSTFAAFAANPENKTEKGAFISK
jgi:hypothetical protein